MKTLLKELCLTGGWSYGLFWRIHQPNSMLLTLEDAYYEEEHINGSLIDDMLLQVHVLGEGTIGQAALNGKHRWMKNHMFENDGAQFSNHFFAGIKTIAIIPVEARGVAQFGSVSEILETLEFVDQTRRLMQGTDDFGPSDVPYLSLNRDGNELSASIPSSGNSFYSDLMLCQLPLPAVQLEGSSPWMNAIGNLQCDSAFEPSYFAGPTLMEGLSHEYSSSKIISGQSLNGLGHESYMENGGGPHTLCTSADELKPVDLLPSSLFDSFEADDLSEKWPVASAGRCVAGLDNNNMVSTNVPQAVGLAQNAPLCGVHPAYSPQSLVTNVSDPCSRGKSLDVPAINNTVLFDSDFGGAEVGGDTTIPLADNKNVLPANSSVSECVSKVEGGSELGQFRGLFSEPGLDQFLSSASAAAGTSPVTQCGLDQDPSSTSAKRRKMETLNPLIEIEIELAMGSGRTESGWNFCNLEKTRDVRESSKLKPQVGSWIDRSSSSSGSISGKSYEKNTSQVPHKKTEEAPKVTKKKGIPKPRPKDRQMIADRMKDLKEMIPNGAKCSIDALLDRTIKHMLFLESLSKYADKLRCIKEKGHPCSQLNGQEHNIFQHPKSCTVGNGENANCAWVVEIGGETPCPVKVENLSYPGLMLIEMLCDDGGFFLEIADAVRSFGLTILKGLLEVRGAKIWAHFIVETNRHIERVDIVIPLIRLFLETPTNNADNAN